MDGDELDTAIGAWAASRTTAGSPARRQRGSVVIGLLPGDLRASGCAEECLQIRLEPQVAAAVLGASPDLSETMAPLVDLWGRDAGRVEDRLRTATSWDERFTIATEILGRRLPAGRSGSCSSS
ncbi:MAG TPA: hypothetical protein VGX25_07605 [Actinophytocola sp.]|uniref:hypothetical protein n=1 Tax=Actinophytocola sp. TaxID=1872138 RepID=UPI002DDD8D0E|nr:hypothetical protein [Actinophytocola sp.]HEV2779252.1 hypothetical protein [Actinophytocola sp.]